MPTKHRLKVHEVDLQSHVNEAEVWTNLTDTDEDFEITVNDIVTVMVPNSSVFAAGTITKVMQESGTESSTKDSTHARTTYLCALADHDYAKQYKHRDIRYDINDILSVMNGSQRLRPGYPCIVQKGFGIWEVGRVIDLDIVNADARVPVTIFDYKSKMLTKSIMKRQNVRGVPECLDVTFEKQLTDCELLQNKTALELLNKDKVPPPPPPPKPPPVVPAATDTANKSKVIDNPVLLRLEAHLKNHEVSHQPSVKTLKKAGFNIHVIGLVSHMKRFFTNKKFNAAVTTPLSKLMMGDMKKDRYRYAFYKLGEITIPNPWKGSDFKPFHLNTANALRGVYLHYIENVHTHYGVHQEFIEGKIIPFFMRFLMKRKYMKTLKLA